MPELETPSLPRKQEGSLVFQAELQSRRFKAGARITASLVWSQALLTLPRVCLVLDWSFLKACPALGCALPEQL